LARIENISVNLIYQRYLRAVISHADKVNTDKKKASLFGVRDLKSEHPTQTLPRLGRASIDLDAHLTE
jgi:hypothetical protein